MVDYLTAKIVASPAEEMVSRTKLSTDEGEDENSLPSSHQLIHVPFFPSPNQGHLALDAARTIPGFIMRSILAVDPENIPWSRVEQLFSCAPSSLEILKNRISDLETLGDMRSETEALTLGGVVEVIERKTPFHEIRDRIENLLLPHIPWHECERLNSQKKLTLDCVKGVPMSYCSIVSGTLSLLFAFLFRHEDASS